MEQKDDFPRLRGRITSDVVIVGGGLTGLTAAALMSRCGLRTVLVEARRLGCGASARCTGVVSMGVRVQYADIEKKRGLAALDACAATRRSALEKLREWKTEAAFGWQDIEVALCASDNQTEELLLSEKESLGRAGIQTEIRSVDGPFSSAAALQWKRQAILNPRDYLRFLQNIALQQRVSIFERSRVLSMDADTVYTEEGSVRAPYIVIATGYPILNAPGYYFLRLEQRKSWGIHLQGERTFDSVYADARGAYVLRPAAQGGIFQFNGARPGLRENDQPKRQFRSRYASALNLMEEEWQSGLEVYSADGLPFIGTYSLRTPNLYVAAGYGGEGILGSVMAAQALSARILGLPSQGYEVYSPQRRWELHMPLQTAAQYLKGNLLHFRQPRCPHMGCRLVYNPREKLWECPCHGSQFDRLGRVLSAPAVCDADIGKH